MKIFSYDSRFSQVMLKVCYGCYLNILWLICSLPIVTAGAATTALYDVSLKIAGDLEPAVTGRFFKSFKNNFKQATQLWLILFIAGILLAGDGYVLYHLFRATTGPVSIFCTLLLALVIVAGIIYVIILMYIFPLIASFENTNRAMLKNSFLIGIRYLFCTILVFAIHFAMFFAVVALYTPLIIFGEGCCALLSSFLLIGVIRACSPKEENEEDQEAMDQDRDSDAEVDQV